MFGNISVNLHLFTRTLQVNYIGSFRKKVSEIVQDITSIIIMK